MPIITELFREDVDKALREKQEKMRVRIDFEKVLSSLSNGKKVEEIALEVYVSHRTLESHINDLRKIFRSSNITELCCTALRLGIIK